MKILLLTDSGVFAGTECQMLELAAELVRQGVDATLASPPGSILAQRSALFGVRHIGIGKGRGPDLRAVMQLRALLREGSVNLIHTHNGRTAFLAAAAVRLARRGRLITSQHFLHPSHTRRRGPRLLMAQTIHRWIYRTAAACIAVSGAVRDALLVRRQIEPGKVCVVHNGISVREAEVTPEEKIRIRTELGVAPGVPLVMCVARLEAEKDVSTLVEAMSTVRQRFPQSRCVIVGEGREREALLRQVCDSELHGSVVFTGFRSDASVMIAACDLFVLPSAVESFGLVLLEAMRHSKPLIATCAGGPQEVVIHDETGLLVPPRNPAALASAISSLLSNPDRARAFGNRGCERLLDLYTSERMACKTTAVYRKAFESR